MQKFFTDGVKLWLFRRHTENISQDQWCSLSFSGFGCWGEFSSITAIFCYRLKLFVSAYLMLRWFFINKYDFNHSDMNFLLSSKIVCFSILIAFVPIWSSVYTTQVVTPQSHLKSTMLSYLKQTFNEHWYWKVYIFQFSQEFLATRSPCVCDFRPNAWWDALFKRLIFIQMLSSLKILRYLFHYFHIIYWFLPMISYS